MNMYICAVESKKSASVSSSLETILTSTSHNSISETLDHILSGQTEFDSSCRIQPDHSNCEQVSLKWSYEMLKSGCFQGGRNRSTVSSKKGVSIDTPFSATL